MYVILNIVKYIFLLLFFLDKSIDNLKLGIIMLICGILI